MLSPEHYAKNPPYRLLLENGIYLSATFVGCPEGIGSEISPFFPAVDLAVSLEARQMVTGRAQGHSKVPRKHAEVDAWEQRNQTLGLLTVDVVRIHFLARPSDPGRTA